MPAPTNKPVPPIPTPEERPTMSVEDAGLALGIRTSKAYKLARTGELTAGVPRAQVSSSYKVPTAAMRRVLGLD